MAVVLQAASREALAEVLARLDAVADTSRSADLVRIGDELFAVTGLLAGERVLRTTLGDASTPADDRAGLARRLLGDRLSAPTLDTVVDVVTARWSRPADLVDATEALARRALLAAADVDGDLDDVEDELFRFGRILQREPELNRLLADTARPVDGRVRLLEGVLGSRVTRVTSLLLTQTVRLPRGRHLDIVAEDLAAVAAARRNRSLAVVRTPVPLAEAQDRALADTLSRLYGRPMSLQIELDESLLGGLVVQVGGDIIDGSVAGRLAAARRAIPS